MNKLRMKNVKGFTLVELLIVIALIAILSVAVLATINPIEQANKAKDSSIQNDAAEILNAYERFYANAQKYPWQGYNENGGAGLGVDESVFLKSTDAGFGICYAPSTGLSTADGACNTSGTSLGMLIANDELKGAFASKGAFKGTVKTEDHLWTVKIAGSGSSIYVCYIPKAKASRTSGKMNCIDDVNKKVIPAGTGTCTLKPVTDTTWNTPTWGEVDKGGMFRCVPE